jgi:hypothetical protein
MDALPTDRKLLKRIYRDYVGDFIAHSRTAPIRDSKIYVPIDIRQIASLLKTDPDLLFGRLYYHLDHKYRYRQDDGSNVHLFSLRIGSDMHCVNFPYLAAILSDKNVEHSRTLWALGLSIAAFIVSLAPFLSDLWHLLVR